MILLALLLATIPQPANTVVVGAEGIVITAVSNPAAQLWFGTGSTYCSTAVSLTKFPLTVSYSSPNPALCASDPASGVSKQIVAQELAAPYTINYSLNNVAQKPITVPALPPLLVCSGTASMPTTTSNGSFSVTCK